MPRFTVDGPHVPIFNDGTERLKIIHAESGLVICSHVYPAADPKAATTQQFREWQKFNREQAQRIADALNLASDDRAAEIIAGAASLHSIVDRSRKVG